MYYLNLETKGHACALTVLDCTYTFSLMSPGSVVAHVVASGSCFDSLALPGTPMSLTLRDTAGFRRDLHGILVTCNEAGWRHGKPVYRLELSSWWSLLRLTRRCRIFQDMSIPDIVQAAMKDCPSAQIRLELSGTYERHVYRVQYRETDYDFCHRLLEEAGIYYRIDHEADTHTIVFCDSEQFPPLKDEQSVVRYRPDDEEGRILRPGIQVLDRKRSLVPQQTLVNDYDYHNPVAKLQASHGEGDRGSWYIDTSGHTTPEQGAARARLRQEAVTGQASVAKGRANLPTLDAGRSFQLQGHPDPDRDRIYNLIAVEAFFTADGPDSTGSGFTMRCQFEALDEAVAFKPPCTTAKPQAPSLQGAVVVGPPGVEVHTDALARVRVRFHWDNEHDTEEDASCWMRVAQQWAGKGWGSLMLPRVGQEVLVGFVEGDIDRPIVTATVYNAENPPPFDLPAQASQSGFVSRSLADGQPSEASSIIFDDARGEELLKLHAERDMTTSVEQNQSLTVGKDRQTDVGRDMKTNVEQNQSLTIGKDRQLNVGRSMTTNVPKLTRTVDKKLTRTASSTSWTGTSFSINELSTNFTGVGSSVRGVGASITGVSSSITGVSTSITGQNMSIVTSSIGMTGSSVSVTGSSMSATGSSQSVTGFSRSTTGMSHGTTGVDLKKAGTKSSSAGMESKTRGMQSKN